MSNRGTIRRGLPDRAMIDPFERREFRVYDVEKKELIAIYPSIKKTANELGIDYAQALDILQNKRRHKNKKLGLTITIR